MSARQELEASRWKPKQTHCPDDNCCVANSGSEERTLFRKQGAPEHAKREVQPREHGAKVNLEGGADDAGNSNRRPLGYDMRGAEKELERAVNRTADEFKGDAKCQCGCS